MGFHVRCSGAELLRKLQDADRFMEGPYALYIIALATIIDDAALDWLMKYEMAFDSMTGPFAAFFLFYNEALLETQPYPRWAEQHPRSIAEIQIDGRTLRRRDVDVDDLLRFNPAFRPSRDVFIRSMTYESDAIARELGILDQLPCLLFLDDPRSSQFYVMPLRQPDNATLQDIRDLLSQFINAPQHAKFFEALKEWHGIKSHQRKLIARMKELQDMHRDIYKRVLIKPELEEAKNLLLEGRAKQFRKKVNAIAGYLSATHVVPWDLLRQSSNQIASARSLAKKIRIQTDPVEIERLMKKAWEILRVSPTDYSESPAKIANDLDAFVIEETEHVMYILYSALEFKPDGSIDYPWASIEKDISKLEEILNRLLASIQEMERPKFGPFIQDWQRRKRRAVMFYKFETTAVNVMGKTLPILDIISKILLHTT